MGRKVRGRCEAGKKEESERGMWRGKRKERKMRERGGQGRVRKRKVRYNCRDER